MANGLIKMLETRMYAANRKVRAVPGDAPTPEWHRLLAEASHAASEYETAVLKAASTKHAHFKVVDIERILRAAKNAGVPVRIGIDGPKITVENLEEHGRPMSGPKEAVEPAGKIVL